MCARNRRLVHFVEGDLKTFVEQARTPSRHSDGDLGEVSMALRGDDWRRIAAEEEYRARLRRESEERETAKKKAEEQSPRYLEQQRRREAKERR